MLRRSALLFLLAAALLPPYVAAQEAAFEATLADSVVVTASRVPDAARQAGRHVTVLDARDLAALPAASLDEVLRLVGGLETQTRGGWGVQSDLTIRGSSFNGVLFLVDGARFNDPMTGHFLSDLPIPLSEVARVEVLRGPAAALYGPDALGGVVHVQTYTGLRTAASGAARTEAHVRAAGGTHALYDVEAAVRRAGARGALSGATTWQGSRGEPIIGPGGPVRGADGAVRTDFMRRAHTAAAARIVGDAALYARAGFDARDFGAYHFYTPFASDTAREATSTWWAQTRLRGDADGAPWEVHLAGRVHRDAYVYNPVTPANEHTSRLLTLHARRSYGRGAWRVTGGGGAHLRGIDSNNLGTHGDAGGGVFAHARWRPAGLLTLHAAARLDADPGYGLAATPDVRAVLTPGAWTLSAAAGRAVRAPNYVERYYNTTLARPRGRNLGNPDLRPESAWTYEAAVSWGDARTRLRAGVFARSTRDLIDYARLTPADTVFLARNLHRVRTRGIELDAGMRADLGPADLRLDASYTLLDADLGATEPGVEHKYALTSARHLVQARARVGAGAVTLGAAATWKERRTGDRDGVVDLRLGWVRRARGLAFEVKGEVRNVLDRRYADVFDAPLPGRWWVFGLGVRR